MDPMVPSLPCSAVLGLLLFTVFIFHVLWLRPERIRSTLHKQGIRGPPPSLLYGNILEMKQILAVQSEDPMVADTGMHDYVPRIFPYYHQWCRTYGKIFCFSKGLVTFLFVSDPDLVKEISLCKSLKLGKPSFIRKERGALFGHGILTSNGEDWLHQRKIIAPQFYLDKTKRMVGLMVESAFPMLEEWERAVERSGGHGDVRVDDDLKNFSADVISKICFGRSYVVGKDVFLKLRALQEAISKQTMDIGIPGRRLIPTASNRKIWRLKKEIKFLIVKALEESQNVASTMEENSLLNTLVQGGAVFGLSNSTGWFVVDNCKNLLLAGHETTSTTATWCLMLLAANSNWQTRVRDEVAELCGSTGIPDAETIKKMKVLTMVIHETLRLYPPSAFMSRETFEEMKFGGIVIPSGTTIWIPITKLHHDTEIWGDKALAFDPERFRHGINSASEHPHAYAPFGCGPRTCLGQNLAMVELKVILSLIISKFTFSLSPVYRHSPVFRLVIQPEFGLHLEMKNI